MRHRAAILAEIGDHALDQRFVVRIVEPAQVRHRIIAELGFGRPTGEHDMHAHAERLHLDRQAFSERIHCRLARAVDADERQGLERHGGGDVDDHARPPRAELRKHRLQHGQCAQRVGLEQLARRLRLDQLDRHPRAETRIVDKHVDIARFFHCPGDARGIGDVERQDDELVGYRQDIGSRVAHRGDHPPAAIEEQFRRFEAETR